MENERAEFNGIDHQKLRAALDWAVKNPPENSDLVLKKLAESVNKHFLISNQRKRSLSV